MNTLVRLFASGWPTVNMQSVIGSSKQMAKNVCVFITPQTQ